MAGRWAAAGRAAEELPAGVRDGAVSRTSSGVNRRISQRQTTEDWSAASMVMGHAGEKSRNHNRNAGRSVARDDYHLRRLCPVYQ